MQKLINRRNFLKGSGVLLSLPIFEAFTANTKNSKIPTRLVYLGYIYGVTKDNNWFPKQTGLNYDITPGLKPLEKHKKNFTVFANIHNPHAKDSHFSCTTLYTGADLTRTAGRSFHNDISCDQVAAKFLGKETRFNSLELGKAEGGSGPGLSLAWDQAGKPLPGMADPLEIFNALFGDGKISIAERKQLIRKKYSILDAVNEESKSIHRVISKSDKEKLEEYFQSIRQIEGKLQKATTWLDVSKPKAPMKSPKSNLKGTELVKTMFDLIVAGLQTDSTRVASYVLPMGSLLRETGIKYNSHQLSHHRSDDDTKDESLKRDVQNTELFSYFIDKLKATKEYDGSTLFDHSVVTYGSGVRYGHMLRKFPMIVTGGGSGRLKHQGYLELEEGKNKMSNLCYTSLRAAGISTESFSDSNGLIEELWV